MAISLAQAAEATGRDRSTILRGIKKGTISATRDQRTQAWLVEPAELFRAFPPMHAQAMPQPAQASAEAHNGESVLLARLEAAEARLADAHDQITDLRRRLDTESEERRKVQVQLTAVLTDQRAATPPGAPEPPTSAWGRFLAWRRGR